MEARELPPPLCAMCYLGPSGALAGLHRTEEKQQQPGTMHGDDSTGHWGSLGKKNPQGPTWLLTALMAHSG